MKDDEVGYLGLTLRLFGTEVFYFRLDVDDFKTKWAIVGTLVSVTLIAVAKYVGPLVT